MAESRDQRVRWRIEAAIPPERREEFMDLWHSYRGDIGLLEHFLDVFGSDDPWEAAANATLERAVFRTPQELRDEEAVVTSVSGHKLKNQFFLLRNRKDPSRTWISGIEAAAKPMLAFASEEAALPFTDHGPAWIAREREQQARRSEREFEMTLEELLRDPARIPDVRSRNDRIRIRAALGLDEELERRFRMLDRLAYGATARSHDPQRTYWVAADPGGRLFGWLERRFRKDPSSIPIPIRDAYTTLAAPVPVPEEERRLLFGTLFAYAAKTMPVNREAIIGGHQQDLDYVLRLAEERPDHPVLREHGVPDLGPIRHILERHEITPIEATAVLDAYPIDNVRKGINLDYFDRFDLGPFLDELRSLFFEGDALRQDALGPSVPMQRLDRSIYRSALRREDFAALRDYFILDEFTRGEPYKGLPIGEYRCVVDSLVLASRKTRRMWEMFERHGIEVADPADAESLVEEWKGLRKRSLRTCEEFTERYGMPIRELIDRYERTSLSKSSGDWLRLGERLKDELRFGLYEDHPKLKPLVDEAAELVPTADLEERYPTAVTLIREGLVHGPKYLSVGQSYVSPDMATRIAAMADAIPASEADMAALERRRGMRSVTFYDGALGDQLKVMKGRYDDSELWERVGPYRVLDTSRLDAHLDATEARYFPATASWVAKARLLSKWETGGLLEQHGLLPTGSETWKTLQGLEEGALVSKELLADVARTYHRIRQDVELPQDALPLQTYQLALNGSTRDDAGRLKAAFPEMQWTGKNWESKKLMEGLLVAALRPRIDAYNHAHGAALTPEYRKR